MRGMRIAVAALALTGCEPPTDMIAVADRAVTQFHQRLDSDQVAAIKADADPSQPIASDRAAGMLNAQRLRLGKVVSSKRTALKDEYGAKGRMLTMTHDTVFADGTASEEFVYLITGGKAVLVSYTSDVIDNAVTDFHKRLDAGDFDAIAAAVGPDLVGKDEDLRAALDVVHTRMGRVKSTKPVSFNARIEGGVRIVELTYETVFTNGTEREEFVFHVKPGGAVELDGYYVKPAGEK